MEAPVETPVEESVDPYPVAASPKHIVQRQRGTEAQVQANSKVANPIDPDSEPVIDREKYLADLGPDSFDPAFDLAPISVAYPPRRANPPPSAKAVYLEPTAFVPVNCLRFPVNSISY